MNGINTDTRRKLEAMINSRLYPENLTKLNARECEVCKVTDEDAREFLDTNHLQGYSTASINLALKYRGKIVGIMTFGVPKFDKEFEYELVRMVYKIDTIIVDGTERLFKYFLYSYNPSSIISY